MVDGVGLPEEVAERHAEGSRTRGGGRKVRKWAKGEYDEGLIREQVGFPPLGVDSSHLLEVGVDGGLLISVAHTELQFLGGGGHEKGPGCACGRGRMRRCG